jgi:hypothetical protein
LWFFNVRTYCYRIGNANISGGQYTFFLVDNPKEDNRKHRICRICSSHFMEWCDYEETHGAYRVSLYSLSQINKIPSQPPTLQIPFSKTYADYSKSHSAVNFEKLLKTTSNGSPFSLVRAPPLPQFHIQSIHKVSTYVEYRAVSGVFQTIEPRPPSPPNESVLPPAPKARYTLVTPHTRRAVRGSIFWKTPDIGLASYSIISLRVDTYSSCDSPSSITIHHAQ